MGRDYSDLIKSIDLSKDLDVSSTFYNRTFHSVQSLLAGLLPRGNIFDLQIQDTQDKRLFPQIKVEPGLVTESEARHPFKGDYYPINVMTAPKNQDKLLKTWTYKKCVDEFKTGKA